MALSNISASLNYLDALPGFPSGPTAPVPSDNAPPVLTLPSAGTTYPAATATASAPATAGASTASNYVAPALALGKWAIAVVVYLAAISFMTPKQAAGLSLVLVLGALLYAQQHGHDVLHTLGVD